MKCKNCGTEIPEGLPFCADCGEKCDNSPKKELPAAVRVLLSILSVLLCVVLTVSLLATALILDYRQLTSKSSIEKTASQILNTPLRSRQTFPLNAAAGGLELGQSIGQTSGQLADWIYGSLKEQYGDELTIMPDQVQSFMEKSTVDDFVISKVVSYTDDFINGTKNTTISTEELRILMEENAALIESEFGIEVTQESLDAVVGYVADMKLDEVIRTQVIDNLENLTIVADGTDLPDGLNSAQDGYTVGDLMADLRSRTSDMALITAIAVNVLLIMILFFTNRMRLPGTLVSAGVPMLIAGGLLSLPTAILQLAVNGSADLASRTIGALVGSVAPVHYIMLLMGLLLIIAATVAKAVPKKK